MKYLTTLFAFLLSAAFTYAQLSPVKVAEGILQGTAEGSLTVYKGVPFAAPPVGNLRWKAPQPAAKWISVRLADKFAPGPMQGDNPPSGKSKDCLYLNVWTPNG